MPADLVLAWGVGEGAYEDVTDEADAVRIDGPETEARTPGGDRHEG
ncbi:hypothetical protein [Streptomyces chromofuscus]|nr:hypothetical protein [Streptomyces chromofuscus]